MISKLCYVIASISVTHGNTSMGPAWAGKQSLQTLMHGVSR